MYWEYGYQFILKSINCLHGREFSNFDYTFPARWRFFLACAQKGENWTPCTVQSSAYLYRFFAFFSLGVKMKDKGGKVQLQRALQRWKRSVKKNWIKDHERVKAVKCL